MSKQSIGTLGAIALILALAFLFSQAITFMGCAQKKESAEKAAPGEESGGSGEDITPPQSEVPEPLSPVDRILESMQWGNIVFNAPQAMRLRETRRVHLLLGPSQTVEELEDMLSSSDTLMHARVRFANRMQAKLTGDGFEVKPITPELQAASARDVTEWKWDVIASEAGEHELHLVLNAIIEVEGKDLPRAIKTFDQVIVVQVSIGQRISGFVSENWKWLWTAILVPLAGWLWKRRQGQKA